jgi:hypothetical protein
MSHLGLDPEESAAWQQEIEEHLAALVVARMAAGDDLATAWRKAQVAFGSSAEIRGDFYRRVLHGDFVGALRLPAWMWLVIVTVAAVGAPGIREAALWPELAGTWVVVQVGATLALAALTSGVRFGIARVRRYHAGRVAAQR